MNGTENILVDINRLPSTIGTVRENDGRRLLNESDKDKVLKWICEQIKKQHGKGISITLYPMPWWIVGDITLLLAQVPQVKKLECKTLGQPGPGHVVFDKGAQ